MRWMRVFLMLLFLPAACNGNVEKAAVASEARLYAYRSEPPTLVRLTSDMSRIDKELPLTLAAGCVLSGLYPSPQHTELAAELMCTYGPVTMLVDMTNGAMTPLIQESNLDSHFLNWAGIGGSVYVRVGSMTEPRLMRVDTSSLRAVEIAINAYTYDLAASTHEGRILFSFSSGIGLGSELWSAGENGRGPESVLVDEKNIIAFARPSPANELVAFIKIPDSAIPYTTGELWVVDEVSGEERMLAEADAGHGYTAAWSPDGSRIAFVVRSNPGDIHADTLVEALISNIAVVDVASGEMTLVTHFEQGRATSPIWSPDGNTLTFGYVLDGRMNVLIADPTGQQAETVIVQEACCPAWMRK